MAEEKKKKGAPRQELPEPMAEGDEKRVVLAREMLPLTLPVIPIGNRPVFPRMIVPLIIEDEKAKKIIEDMDESARFVGVILRRQKEADGDQRPAKAEELHSVGVAAQVLRVQRSAPEGPIHVVLGILERFVVEEVIAEEPALRVRVRYLFSTEMSVNEELKAYSVAIINCMKELSQLSPLFKEELSLFVSRADLSDPGRLADFSASMTTAEGRELQDILETTSIRQRIEKALILLKKELDVSKLQAKINKQIEEKLSSQQRKFFLREQLKAIKKELGLAKEGKEAEIEEFEARLKGLALPPEAEERVNEEMQKLSLLEPASPEFTVTRNYLDWLTSLPWGVFTSDNYDIKQAALVLDRDHYGLDDVKERILEFLSVGILKGRVSGSIICFIGPPGVGKTSIGRSIAESIGRKFYRFSLGGMRDEAEIKGHRRTYIGALPGKFIQALRLCKSANPLIMLDEVDKIGASFRGDPASALLEVLDPEQNKDFLDHYLDVRFDLSNALFICTANVPDTIPKPLMDRMEVMKLPGYIIEEKLQIARKYLFPKQVRAAGLKKSQISITTGALREIIEGYAREPGVRNVEKNIKKICEKTAREIVEKKRESVRVDSHDVPKLLGKRVFSDEDLFKESGPGVVTGLAWTSLGGETIHVEASRVKSERPGFKQTGQLGSVMAESAEIAYSFVRSFLSDLPEAAKLFETGNIHLHVPSGATPKDGPSAGITMASALYSLAMNKPARRRLAMTGELSLTGLVMPVGGIKEKTLAAKRAGITMLILPKENKKDYEELPAKVRRGLKPFFVGTFEEAIKICFPK